MRVRVLIADDDEVIRSLLHAVATNLGWEPVAVAGGEEAWQLHEAAPFPLVVLDIGMSEVGGLEVCRRIRAADANHETFVLVLTARSPDTDVGAVLEAGADDYLTKPATASSVRARLVIAHDRVAQEARRRTAEDALARARWMAGIGEATAALQHEINNPLSALMGHAELMMIEDEEAGRSNDHVRVIVEQARRIADVVKRLGRLRNVQTVEYAEGRRMLDLGHPREES